jgi:hypothetical protein
MSDLKTDWGDLLVMTNMHIKSYEYRPKHSQQTESNDYGLKYSVVIIGWLLVQTHFEV